METHPKTVWLQYHGDQKPEQGEVVSVRDVTWSENKEFAWDIGPYVLRSELERENARLRAVLLKMYESPSGCSCEVSDDAIKVWAEARAVLFPMPNAQEEPRP